MNLTQMSQGDFLSSFKTTDELLAQASQPQVTPVTPETPIVDTSSESTDALLAKAGLNPVEVKPEVAPEGDPAPEEPETPAPTPAPNKNALPENFSTFIKAAEDEGLLVGFEDGKYETVDDFISLLKENESSRRETLQKEATEQLFNSFSPAMQAILQYANMGVKNPQELAPYITAVDNLQYSLELNPEQPEHREEIIRNALLVQGMTLEIAEAEIQDLKSQGDERLTQRAKVLKPVLDTYNQNQIKRMHQEQYLEQQKEIKYWQDHANTVKTKIIDTDNINGIKLRKQDKQLIYSTLALPDAQTGELPIYSIIDKLLEKGDIETLAEMALLGLDKKTHRNYISSSVSQKQAEITQRALRTQTQSTPIQIETDDKPKLKRPTEYKRPTL